MKLKFKLKDKKHINIINEDDGRIVGEIFTPSGTGEKIEDAIQVCGFSRAFELWGCGRIGDNKGSSLQDIQLLFKNFKSNTGSKMRNVCFGAKNLPVMDKKGCDRCFHWKDKEGNCKCSELKVFKRYKDIAKYEKRRESYERKINILGNLEDKNTNR